MDTLINIIKNYNVKLINITNDKNSILNKKVKKVFVINLLEDVLKRNYIVTIMNKLKINFTLVIVDKIQENIYDTLCPKKHISKEELRVIPDEEVYNLYKELYWNKVQGDYLPAGVDYAVFDSAVNMGVGRAAKLIQEAVGVTADGVLGPASVSAIQKTDPKELIEKFSALKESFYRSLKTFPTFGKGWLNRVAEVKTTSESMLG